MSDEPDNAFNALIISNLSDIKASITSIRESQIETATTLTDHQTAIAKDLSDHREQIAHDLAEFNRKQSDRVNAIAADLYKYKLDSEIDCNAKHLPINEKLTVITTKNMTVGAIVLIAINLIGAAVIAWFTK